jgi:hypothetical protein
VARLPGSVQDEAELEALKAAVQQRIAAGNWSLTWRWAFRADRAALPGLRLGMLLWLRGYLQGLDR